jgi:hypothetical protein
LHRHWSGDGSIGLDFPESDAEIVLHCDPNIPTAWELAAVDSAGFAAEGVALFGRQKYVSGESIAKGSFSYPLS